VKKDVGLSKTMASLKAIWNELKGEVEVYNVELGMIKKGGIRLKLVHFGRIFFASRVQD